ncbi:conserved exported protein of unknown function [Bradyrhizobium sp. ORS 285]|uniref:hypothetical protein n=1 Tax=Bradyrhizobium sp. ORS 285 TaxID=115808 RepID=UPI00024061C4|nr:hypothetical protein [Bradyrhizobium sp. ORS 285]CCD86041.1 conserved exported hypothetical protein [Bradyrhizobium sp. ORS 285]SMX56782.1 conserved exported protein of unknown function [Bradyrhizobium sp. ORS 285]
MRKLLPLLFIVGAIATAQAQETTAVRQACGSEVRTLCAGIMPGGGRIKQCMIEKFDKLSDGCRSAIKDAKAQQGGK